MAAHQSDALGVRGVLRVKAMAVSACHCHLSIWALAFAKHTLSSSHVSRLVHLCVQPLLSFILYLSYNVFLFLVCQRCGAGCFCSRFCHSSQERQHQIGRSPKQFRLRAGFSQLPRVEVYSMGREHLHCRFHPSAW